MKQYGTICLKIKQKEITKTNLANILKFLFLCLYYIKKNSEKEIRYTER